jgi:hypothetical protein
MIYQLTAVENKERMSMTLIESLHTIPDFRRKQGQRYPLIAVLLITIMSIMCGRCRYR